MINDLICVKLKEIVVTEKDDLNYKSKPRKKIIFNKYALPTVLRDINEVNLIIETVNIC